jgi:hypothetical protein
LTVLNRITSRKPSSDFFSINNKTHENLYEFINLLSYVFYYDYYHFCIRNGRKHFTNSEIHLTIKYVGQITSNIKIST